MRRLQARSDVARRLGEIEAALGGERKCRCRVWIEDVDKPWAQSIILAHPGGDDSKTCPDCGGQRIVVLMDPSFGLDDQ